MAKRREIQFQIDDSGNVSIQVKGVDGTECERLTREIEEALGVVSDRQRTSEYYKEVVTEEKVGLEEG